jgi:hypothetical protein
MGHFASNPLPLQFAMPLCLVGAVGYKAEPFWGHHTKRQKIVRLGLLRKPIASRKPIAIQNTGFPASGQSLQ